MSLYERVCDDRLKVSLILTTPRTGASALARALATSPDIDHLFYQAFDGNIHGSKKRTEEHIEKKLKEIEQSQRVDNHPVHVLFKEMAYDIENAHEEIPEALQRFGECCDNVIVLCRDPHHQMYSHIKAGYRATDHQPPSIEDLSELSPRWYETHFSKSWTSLKNMVAQLDGLSKKMIFADGDLLRYDPDTYLWQLCEEMEIKFSDEMINGWRSIDESEMDSFSNYGGYTNRVMQTQCLHPPRVRPPAISDYSPDFKEQLLDELSVYMEFMSDERGVRPTERELWALARDGVNGNKLFSEVCPVTLYALSEEHVRTYLYETEERYRESFDVLDKMHKSVPQHIDAAPLCCG